VASEAARVLVLVGASIFGALGGLHLAYTFFTDKFLPRDAAVLQAMKSTSMILTRQTTMWDAWVGFNGSHSLGAILLAVLYGILAASHMDVLASSRVLLPVAAVTGLGYVFLAYTYWFSVPFAGVTIATACFVAAAVLVYF